MNRTERKPGRRLALLIMGFYLLAFLLRASRDNDTLGYILAVAVPVMIYLGTNFLPHLFPADRLLMSLANFLCAMGVLLLYTTNPAYALQQAVAYGIGLGAMIVCIYLVRLVSSWRGLVLLMIPAALVLLAAPLVMGQEINGAKNWIALGSVSFQPSEAVKLILVVVLAWFLSHRRHLPWLLFLLACVLFITNTHSRRKYYIGNAVATALNVVAECALAVWCHIQVSAFKTQYLTTVDFEQLERRLSRRHHDAGVLLHLLPHQGANGEDRTPGREEISRQGSRLHLQGHPGHRRVLLRGALVRRRPFHPQPGVHHTVESGEQHREHHTADQGDRKVCGAFQQRHAHADGADQKAGGYDG